MASALVHIKFEMGPHSLTVAYTPLPFCLILNCLKLDKCEEHFFIEIFKTSVFCSNLGAFVFYMWDMSIKIYLYLHSVVHFATFFFFSKLCVYKKIEKLMCMGGKRKKKKGLISVFAQFSGLQDFKTLLQRK